MKAFHRFWPLHAVTSVWFVTSALNGASEGGPSSAGAVIPAIGALLGAGVAGACLFERYGERS